MAILKASTRRKQLYNGTHGNLSAETLKATLNGAAVNDEVEMGVIPAGTEVTRLETVFDALGAGTSIDLGYRYVDEENGSTDLTYWGNQGTASAGASSHQKKPKRFEHGAILVATVKGGAATGELFVIPHWIGRGNK